MRFKKIMLIALIVILAASAYVVGLNYHARGPVGGEYPVAVPTPKGYGFAGSFKGMSHDQIDARLSDMTAAGAEWIRIDINWSEVQPTASSGYKWSRFDELVELANSHHMKTIMILDLTPPWARKSGCNSELCAPQDAQAFAKFSSDAVKHYSSYGVKYWEVWNEPNIDYRWRPAANAADYVTLLKAASVAIKQADPTATVIAASLAPSATDKTNYTPSDFIRQMYAHGAAGYFDAISAHPYTYPITPAHSTKYDAWGQLSVIHDLMKENGDGEKQIWITEFGAPTNGPNKKGEYVSEDIQSQILAEAISLYRRQAWSGPFLWYGYQDTGTSTSTSENFYGLIRADGSHKPAYDKWIELTKK